jgi:signal transduction histidine kinase
VPAQFQTAGIGGERLSPQAETTLYRVVLESLTNVSRHARASRVDVLVARLEGNVVVVVEDNGCGFDPETVAHPSGKKLGLLGMKERVALAGGIPEIESSPGAGTSIYARVDLPLRGVD